MMTLQNSDDLVGAIKIASNNPKQFVKVELENDLWLSCHQNPDVEEEVLVRFMNGCAEASVEKIDVTVPHWEARVKTIFPNIVSLYEKTPVVEAEQEMEI